MSRLSFSNFPIPSSGFSQGFCRETLYYREKDVGFPLGLVCLDFSTMGAECCPGKASTAYLPRLPVGVTDFLYNPLAAWRQEETRDAAVSALLSWCPNQNWGQPRMWPRLPWPLGLPPSPDHCLPLRWLTKERVVMALFSISRSTPPSSDWAQWVAMVSPSLIHTAGIFEIAQIRPFSRLWHDPLCVLLSLDQRCWEMKCLLRRGT